MASVVPCNKSSLSFSSLGKTKIGLASSKWRAVGKMYFKKREAAKWRQVLVLVPVKNLNCLAKLSKEASQIKNFISGCFS